MGQEEDFFHVSFLPNRFPMCSPWVLSISPCFNPICFAQSAPLFTYIAGPKGKALHHSIESSILRRLHSFNVVLWWADQNSKIKVGLVKGIAQAKNGGELFWEEKFHAANGKAQACTQGALHFFLLSLEGFGGGYFSVFLGSHHVPF